MTRAVRLQLTVHHGGWHVGINYFQSVTPSLSMGGEAFWLGQQRKSGTGFAARHQGELHVATCQLATTGLINATYIHKVNEKVRIWQSACKQMEIHVQRTFLKPLEQA